MLNLTRRKANINDLGAIIKLLLEDDLGKTREHLDLSSNSPYLKAFELIDQDPNQYLMVIENGNEIVATCHLTIMPSLTFSGSSRMQIEAVRTKEKYRGQKIGQWMMDAALDYAKSRSVSIIQLTTNKKRPRAKNFYEYNGFEASHEGMKRYLK